MLMAATAFAVVLMIAGMRMRVVMMMAVIGVAMIGHRAIRMLHPAIGQMSVIVMVAVNGKALGRSATEQTHIFRALAHRLRRTAAANMTVQAYHGVGFSHHHMQVMRD